MRWRFVLKASHPGIFLLLLAVTSVTQVNAQDRGRSLGSNGIPVSPGTRHPTPENIPEAMPPDLALRETRDAGVFLGGIVADSAVIGVLEGRKHEMLGYIMDVATDGLGTLYVLDSEYNEVRVHDFSGKFLGSFGGPGEGPGEFRHPREIAVSGQLIFVVEVQRVHVFKRQEAGFILIDTFTKDLMGFRGNCALNGHLYTAGYNPEEEQIVHRLTADGFREMALVEIYPSANTNIQSVMSIESLLACSEEHGIVGVIMDNVPALTAYAEDGVVMWRTRLADFKPRIIEEFVGPEGRLMVLQGQGSEDEGASYLHTLFSDGADHFYLGYQTESDDKEYYVDHVFRIDVRTGEGEHLGTGRVAAVTANSVVVASHDPYPRVIIYKRTGVE